VAGGPVTRFDHVEYLCGPRGCGREEWLRAVVYIERDGACVSFMDTHSGRWVSGEPIWRALRRGADIASSDALYAGSPARCTERGAVPARLDLLTLDLDFRPPPVAVEVDGSKYVFRDRATGAELKRAAEGRLKDAVREVARRLGVPPVEVYDAMHWGGGECPSWEYVLRKARRARQRLAAPGVEAMFVYSGAKGFHVKLALPRLYDAEWRPALARGLAQFLGAGVDGRALDAGRKFRVPYTVNSKTGREAFIFDPATGDRITELAWPKPVDSAVVGFLLQSRPASRGAEETGVSPAPARAAAGGGGWLQILLDVIERNPGLRQDCRERLAGVWGCGCAVDGVGVEECVQLFARALGLDPLPRDYERMIKDKHERCTAALARGKKPLFSLREALTCKRDAWYCVRECLGEGPGRASREG